MNKEEKERLKTTYNADSLRPKMLRDFMVKITPDFYPLPAHAKMMFKDKDLKGTILDVGAGYGVLSLIAKQMDPSRELVCLEASEVACHISVALAFKSETTIKVCQGFVEDYPFEENMFDTLIVSHVLEHIDDTGKVFDWIDKITKPDGTVFLFLPYEKSHPDPFHLHFFTDVDKEGYVNLRKILDDRGYEIEEFLIYDDKKLDSDFKDVGMKDQLDFYIKFKVKKGDKK